MKITRSLITVSDKTGVVELAKGLQELDIEIVSTQGTAKILKDNDIKVREISKITNFPEILDGRIKTLHPKILGGILALKDKEKHSQELKKYNIEPIDLIVVNLYPFEKTIKNNDEIEEALENIDIGGHTLIRSAAKNYSNVAIVGDPKKYDRILKELRENDCELSDKTRKELASDTFAHAVKYDTMISNYLQKEFDIKES